jgi:hypothetical protein
MTPSSDSINLLEQLTEFRESQLLFIVKDFTKDTGAKWYMTRYVEGMPPSRNLHPQTLLTLFLYEAFMT